MKYVVIRLSRKYGGNPNCPNITKELVTRNGELQEVYTTEFDSLEAFSQWAKEVGHPVILYANSILGYELPVLEVYDEYRE